MARCRAWRPRRPHGPHPSDHAPGSCRKCWTTCHTRVARGRSMCDECEELLSGHPSADVRVALVRTAGVTRETVDYLLSDLDAGVRSAALAVAGEAAVDVGAVVFDDQKWGGDDGEG